MSSVTTRLTLTVPVDPTTSVALLWSAFARPPADAVHLNWFSERIAGDRVAAKLLLHTGTRTFPLSDGVLAVSISAFWSGTAVR